jgi:hypothetical protein
MPLKLIPKVLACAALVVWFGFIYLFLQYDATRPTSPQPAQGRVHGSNNHGHVTYLTEQEEGYLNLLQIGAVSLFIIAALTGYFQREPDKMAQVRVIAKQTLYGAFYPSSWYAFGARTWRGLRTISIRSIATVLTGRRRISLHSVESISDCRDRLVGSIGFNTVGPVLGSISGDKFHLYIAKKEFRNSFAPQFHGKLVAAHSSTTIVGRFRLHAFVRIFLALWFGGLIIISAKIAVLSIKEILMKQTTTQTYIGPFPRAAFLLCGLIMVYWGKVLGSDDEARIVAFLQNTLNARPVHATTD